jgi:hypothetical protein
MSTGQNQGDGRQASHWKDDQATLHFIGIMDPTLANGTIENVGPADIRSMELIGYDTPEPGSVMLLAIGAVGTLARRRRRSA